MSLDVYLTIKNSDFDKNEIVGSGIFVRENGSTVEISREEWDLRFPGKEPVTATSSILDESEESEVFTANITHNLASMAREAGIYTPLWQPEEYGIEKAFQLILLLEAGLERLIGEKARLEKFSPANGWGNHAALVEFVKTYLAACRKSPDAAVRVWR